MDMKTVRSLADHIISLGWTVDKLTAHLVAAECGHLQAVAAAADKGITMDELCAAFLMAINSQKGATHERERTRGQHRGIQA